MKIAGMEGLKEGMEAMDWRIKSQFEMRYFALELNVVKLSKDCCARMHFFGWGVNQGVRGIVMNPLSLQFWMHVWWYSTVTAITKSGAVLTGFGLCEDALGRRDPKCVTIRKGRWKVEEKDWASTETSWYTLCQRIKARESWRLNCYALFYLVRRTNCAGEVR